MDLTQSTAYPGIYFDPEYFSDADVSRIVESLERIRERASRPPPRPVRRVQTAAFGGRSSVVDRAIARVRRDIEEGVLAPEIFEGQDLDKLEADARPLLEKALLGGSVGEEAHFWQELRHSVRLRRRNTQLEVNGQAILSADSKTDEGRKAIPFLEIAVVAIDIIAVFGSLINLAFEVNPDIKKLCADCVKKATDDFFEFCKKVHDELRPYFLPIEAADDQEEMAKSYIAPIARSILSAGTFAYNNKQVMDAIRAILWDLFQSPWKRASALFRLAAFLVGMIATAGVAIAVSLLQLMATVCNLVNDCIELNKALRLAGFT